MTKAQTQHYRVVCDGTSGGTKVSGPNGEALGLVQKVVIEIDCESHLPKMHITTLLVECDIHIPEESVTKKEGS